MKNFGFKRSLLSLLNFFELVKVLIQSQLYCCLAVPSVNSIIFLMNYPCILQYSQRKTIKGNRYRFITDLISFCKITISVKKGKKKMGVLNYTFVSTVLLFLEDDFFLSPKARRNLRRKINLLVALNSLPQTDTVH